MALVTGFNRLAAGEAMPLRRPLRRRRRRISRAVASWTFMAVWSFMTVSMIAVALVLSHVSHGAAAVGYAALFSGPSR